MLTLYRADQKGRQTRAENFWEGLYTKQLGSLDDPEPHKKYSWLKTIKSHIHALSKEEKHIYNTTAFLSFTSDINQANDYLATTSKRNYISATRENAEAYMFTLTVDEKMTKEISKGYYLFYFYCNYERFRMNIISNFPDLSLLVNCNICGQYRKTLHSMAMIDAASYLKPFRNEFPKAYENAVRDKEWLIIPLDPMVGGPHNAGYQSKLPVADCWNVTFFKYLL